MPEVCRPLISAEAIAAKVEELARAIRADFGDGNILLVGVLKGSFHFLSDLGRALGGETTVDFIQTSSYGTGKSSTGVVQIRKDLDTNIEGRDVLLVEDIVDSGITLQHLRDLLATRHPRRLAVAALLSKPAAHQVQTAVEFVGFEIPPEFVVGYGLDHAERYRNLRYIAVLEDAAE